MLKIDNLSFHHPKQAYLLRDVNLHLRQGELLTILGANGTGKSTLLNCIAGLLQPMAGHIQLKGRNLAELSAKQIAREIAYVSQQPPETYQYKVRDYTVLGRAVHLGLFDQPSAADFALVDEALDKLAISHLADKIYMNLSGGQKQLVNIAKILVQQPQLILFDEPTSALDYGNVFKTLSLIRELAQQGFAIIMTTHNPDHPMLLHSKLPDSLVGILDRQGHFKVGKTPDIITQDNLNALYDTDLCMVDVPELQRKICAIRHI